MKQIKLSGKMAAEANAYALVDDDDYERIAAMGSWYLSDSGYALAPNKAGCTPKSIRMHRVIMDAPGDKVVDHLNRNKLDNRKSNLRICTQKENAKNRFARGYCWAAEKQKYVVRHAKRFYCYADTEDEARQQYVLAKSGVARTEKAHSRRKYLPRGVFYMQPMASKGHAPFYIRPQIDGRRHFKGYFRTVAEAKEAYEQTISATGGLTS